MDSRPNPPVSLRPFRAGYWFGGFNGLTWMMGLGTPMVLLIEHLGGSTIQVGMASSFVFLLLPVQVLSTSTLVRFGFQLQMVLGWSLRAIFLLVPLAIALGEPAAPAPWMANAVVLSVLGFCFFRAFGMAAHITWFAAILPDSLRGRFFATDAAITSGVGVVTLLGCALLFDRLPPYRAFCVAYGIALFGSLLAVVSLLRLPPGPAPHPSPLGSLAAAARTLCFAPGLFRDYLVLTVVGALVGSSFVAFTTYYLKSEVGVPSSQILGFTAAQFGGQILGTFALRPFIDRVAIRRLFQLSQVIVACVFAYWLGIVVGETGWLGAISVSYFVFGVSVGVSNAANATFLPELSPAPTRAVSVAVFGAVAGLLQGLGPMLWGLVLRTGGGEPGVDLESFRVFFALGLTLCAWSLWLLASLPDARAALRGQAEG